MKKSLLLCSLVISIIFVSTISDAKLITFDNVVSSGNPSYSSSTVDGFTFSTYFGGTFQIIDNPSACPYGGCIDNGTKYIAQTDSSGIKITSSTPFKLNGFDIFSLFVDDQLAASNGYLNANAVYFDVWGYDSNFGDWTLDYLGPLGTVSLSSFLTLPIYEVRIWGTCENCNWSNNINGVGFGIDNINITPIPEPSTMILLGSGLFGLVGFRKKFKK